MTLREYLLGMLSVERQAEIEERYFTDDRYFEQLLVAEDELIEAYMNKELSRKERRKFTRNLLSQARWQEKLANLRALQKIVNEPGNRTPAKIGIWQSLEKFAQKLKMYFWGAKMLIGFSYAIILFLIVWGSLWTRRVFHDFESQIAQLKLEQQSWIDDESQLEQQLKHQTRMANDLATQFAQVQQQNEKLTKLVADQEARPEVMLAFALEPGLLRDMESQKRLVIPQNIRTVQLELVMDSEILFKSYAVAIETVTGLEIWSKSSLSASSEQAVVLNLPAAIFTNDDYILTLKGKNQKGDSEVIDKYVFNVARK